MVRYLLSILLFIFLLPSFCFSQYVGTGSNTNTTYVNGYFRSDGTYVQGHYRTSRNSYNLDNFSAKGNFNPYTGEFGDIEYSSPYNSLKENGTLDVNYQSYSLDNYNRSATTTKSWFKTKDTDNPLKAKENSISKNNFDEKENWSNKEFFKTYLLSHETIISKIFYLDLSKSEDKKKYFEIVFNDDKYILNKRFKDLNNDGHKDLLIENHSPGYTGSGGFSTYIFIYESGRYKFLQEFFGDYVEVQVTSSNGFNDMVFSHKKYLDEGGFKYVKDFMTWNGGEYTKLVQYSD
ncbi:hypothetical protein [Fodinibius halophilus]|uniref:VCBS repeat-containing protein n=1 Tax=Fodinibius halophilus TaxID=1736908 RepID=A0A6M1T3Q5_9BACT|nr:hypothetical protein [Fodinibius halophilus]NGP90056.1 hypothetical protein [Fodinibius halophilus]